MRWLFRRGDSDDAPRIVTLQDPEPSDAGAESASAETDRPVRFLPGGDLTINVHNAREARDALLELQRKQRELLSGGARGIGSGVVGVSGHVGRGIVRGGRRVRRMGRRSAARLRPSGPYGNASDTVDATILGLQLASGVDDTVRIIGSAMRTIIDTIPDIDLSDIDLDLLDIFDL